MPKMAYILDDISAAREFVSSLNRKIVRKRFSTGHWEPHHVVLVTRDGQVVAMADCVVSDDGHAANGSLLARSGFGANAIAALLRMKQHVPVGHWQSTLRVPTPSTVGISRRYFDATFDQGAWEISNELMKVHGSQHHLQPTPIIVSSAFLKAAGIPQLHRMDAASRAQLLRAAAEPSRATIRVPNGSVLGATDLMSLAFELLDLPMQVRQNVSRAMLISLAVAHGHNIDMRTVNTLVRSDAMPIFFNAVSRAISLDDQAGGIFTVECHNEDPVASFLAKVSTRTLPSNRA
ncbi:hypothetical protein [Microvirga brassicacearum]|uniref:Uncharacterized protein n=1 Tax=Microvirga brassicacearum TaxID=2580413 RepID=A0A5N3P4V4_9HYPH|nr:hypothetical protein [Microvirga brassicacearum]KAB0264733.1 hypothetical protein FEZ63_22045 [Microvirga brassicacearum]